MSTQAFVACGWGVSRVGYVMIAFGISNAIAAALAGGASKIIGRNKILLFALIVHGALMLWMRQWIAVANDFIAYCSMAAIWGLVDGIWLVIINCELKALEHSFHFRTFISFNNSSIFSSNEAYYGILFTGNEEAAFSNFRLFEASGSVIAYSLSPMLHTDTKIVSIFVLMIIGSIG